MTKYILSLSIITLLFSCSNKHEKTENDTTANTTPTKENQVTLTDAQFNNAKIELGKIEYKNMASVLKTNGKIDVPPKNIVSVSVPSGGYLKNSNLLEGMHVSKGQVLCTIEDKQFIQMQEDYLMAKAKIGYAKAEYERQKELNKSKASSDKVYQQAQTEYNSLNIIIQSYAEKLSFVGINPNKVTANNITKSIGIHSPINGYISKVKVNVGKYVLPNDVLYEIINPNDIHLALNIFEKDVNKLYINQLVTAYSNNNVDKKYLCKIILIGKNLNEDKSVVVHCHFENYEKTLLPGMYMNAEINTNEINNAFVLPSEAIVRFEGKYYVFTQVQNKTYEMQEVLTHNTENGFTQISFLDNLERINSTFVLKGAYNLLMKIKNNDSP